MKHRFRRMLPRKAIQSRQRSTSRFSSRAELLEARMMLAADVTGSPFQNQADPYDVTDDGHVSSRDALIVIKELNRGGARRLEMAEGEGDVVQAASSINYIDVNGDEFLDSRDALTLIRQLNGEGEPGDVVTFRLETTNLAGDPVSSVDVGDEFVVRLFTQDTQDTAEFFGVFAAYVDITYDENLASVTGALQFDGEFENATSGDTSVAGLIDEAGAIAGLSPTGQDELEVFSIRMRADAAGQLTLASNAADNLPNNVVLVFGSDDPVATDDILYGSTTLTIGTQQQPEVDLVGFAQALDAAGVELWSTRRLARARVAEQFALFEDGENFLPFNEALDANLQFNAEAQAAGVSQTNVWIFPDGTRSNGPLLTLQEISNRSGVPIPTGVSPSIAPIDDVTVQNGSPLHIPLDGYDPNGDPLTYTITSGDETLVTTFMPEGNRSLRISTSDAQGIFGDMVFQLFEGRASRATNQIITLAEDGFYDGITFHRVVDGFVIQGGDPTGTGAGGSDLGDFDDQFNIDLQHNRVGVLSMAKSSDDTNDSQFFITETDTRFLDFQHTIFGQLIEGDRVRESISNVPVNGSTPVLPVTMDDVEVFQDTENAIVMLTALASSGSTEITVTATDTAGNSTTETFTVTLASDPLNGQPFLADIPEQVFQPGEDIEFQLTAIDKDNDPVVFSATTSVSGATASVTDQGLVTVTPPADFVGTLPVTVQVEAVDVSPFPAGSFDEQLVNIRIAPDGPSSVDLLAVTDSGVSDTDNITNLTELQFEVDGVETGATVKILLDGDVEIGEGVASGSSITITTANLSAIGDGQHTVTAIQELNGDQSLQSPPINIFLDQTAPAAILNDAPTDGSVGVAYTHDAAHEEEGDTGFRYSLAAAPAGMVVDETTGQVAWTPTGAQRGQQSYELIVTDAAGNSTSRLTTVTVAGGSAQFRLATVDTAGNPISGIAQGGQFVLQVFVVDQRGAPTGISDAFLDVMFDSTRVSIDGSLSIGSDFPNDNSGNTATAGLLDEVGGSTTASLGGGEFLLASIPMQADALGTIVLSGNPADDTGHDVFFAGDPTPVVENDLSFIDASISVLEVADALMANDDEATVDEDSVDNQINVLENDTLGPNSQIVEISSATQPGMGTAIISDSAQSIIYTPAPDFFGTETFTYTIRDGQGATSSAEVMVTVSELNDPPMANPDFFPEDLPDGDARIALLVEDATTTAIGFPVIANDSQEPDSDVDGREIFNVSGVDTTGTVGTVTFEPLGVLYTPAPNFSGVDTFRYVITDFHDPALSATGTVTVTIAEVNDAPTAQNDQLSVIGNTPLQIDASQLLGNDSAGPSESDQTLSIVGVVSGSSNGTVVLNSDGSVTYTPANGFVGTDTFTYTLTDDGTTQGADDFLTATGTVTLTVGEGNTRPTAFDDTASIVGDSAATTLSLLDNDTTDDPSETLQIQTVGTTSAGGTVTIIDNGGAVSYQPATGFVGTETFTYVVTDGELTDTASVTVTVTDPATTTNSLFAGFVFFDQDNDGAMDPGEQGISSVMIRLEGTDIDGNAVSREALTDKDGAYRFEALPRGTFTVSQEQPGFLLDGIDTADTGASSNGNDSFSITVADTVVTSDDNMFAERGLTPRFAMLDALASSRGGVGFLTAITAGQSEWVRGNRGWEDFSSINVELSDDLSQVTITAINSDSEEVQATVSASDRSRVQLLGRDGDTVLVRIAAAAAAFDLQPVVRMSSGVASSSFAAAVDAVFADEA